MEVDWDLQAVVRGFTTTSSTVSSTTTATNGGSSFKPDFNCFDQNKQVGQLFTISDPFEEKVKGDIGELHELFRPFFPKSQPFYSPQAPPLSFLPSPSVSKEQTHPKQPTKLSLDQRHTKPSLASTSSTTPRSKRRKTQVKKICHMPAEAVSSDVWAWRKYGQKPIKGSPFPRGYYRCSSSKGCLARKQVERNRSDPRMFIVTYTAEHNHPAPTHRNSLAGSTRPKTSAPQNITTNDSDKLSPETPPKPERSFPATSLEEELLPLSSNTDSREEKDMMEDEDCEGQEADFSGFSGAEVDDDFFAGLEEFACPKNSGDGFSDHFTGSIGFQWFSNTAATTTGGV